MIAGWSRALGQGVGGGPRQDDLAEQGAACLGPWFRGKAWSVELALMLQCISSICVIRCKKK